MPSKWLWIVNFICGFVIAAVFVGDPIGDQAIGNVVLLVTFFIALISTLTWFAFQSAYALWLRRLVPVAMFIVALVGVFTLRIEKLTGNLVPTFVSRWSPSPDQLLEKPSTIDSTADLITTSSCDFPQFLGPNRSQQLNGIGLAHNWFTKAPRLVWRQEIGAGWSAFSAVNGYAITMEQRGELEMTTCYEIATGKMMWWHGENVRFTEVFGGIGPRATPTIHLGRVYSFGSQGRLMCLEGNTGQVIWQRNVLEDVGTTLTQEQDQITWGRSGSPLIVGNLVVVSGGGPSDGPHIGLIAYRAETGDEVWRSGGHQISYSSPCLATFFDTQQILIVNESSVTGNDPETGIELWDFEWPGNSNSNASISQPVPLSENRVLLSKAYGIGAQLIQIEREVQDDWSARLLWHNRRILKTKFTNVCVREPFVWGLSDGILECIDLTRGKRRWKKRRFGHGQMLMVDDLLLVQSEEGKITQVKANENRFVPLGELETVTGQTWNHLCLYGKYLLVRSDEQAACFELPTATGL